FELLLGEETTRLQLEQRRDQNQELPARIEIKPASLLQAIAKGQDDLGDVDLRELELLPEHKRQQQVERPLERVEVQLELAHDHGLQRSPATGRGPWARPSPGPEAALGGGVQRFPWRPRPG